MISSGLLQRKWSPYSGFTCFARDPKYSWFHEYSKNLIHFLNNGTLANSVDAYDGISSRPALLDIL